MTTEGLEERLNLCGNADLDRGVGQTIQKLPDGRFDETDPLARRVPPAKWQQHRLCM